MRRLAVLAFAVLTIGFALPARAALPTLVVFPFAQSDGVPDNMGAAVVDRISAEIIALGGINVVKGPPATKPADYRKVARDLGADLYYSGSIAPVGSGYSAIEHLVTTRAGTVQWSVTMQFHFVTDIHGEGARVRDEMLRGATPLPFPSQNPV